MNSYRNQQRGYGIYRGVRYQRGNGIYRGVRYQHGNGFLSTILDKAVYPLLKYFGKQGVRTAMAIGKEAVQNPSESFGDIARRQLKVTGMKALDDGAKRVQRFAQTGEGIKKSIKRPLPYTCEAIEITSFKGSKKQPAQKAIKRRPQPRTSFLFR